ncbi:hypothetical protein SGLAM104S_08239 [Streptomyces glaucescens]
MLSRSSSLDSSARASSTSWGVQGLLTGAYRQLAGLRRGDARLGNGGLGRRGGARSSSQPLSSRTSSPLPHHARLPRGPQGGLDRHGLPVELAVEKELGFSGKQDIEVFGIAEFNARCRESALRPTPTPSPS